jgi:hypothetical protein
MRRGHGVIDVHADPADGTPPRASRLACAAALVAMALGGCGEETRELQAARQLLGSLSLDRGVEFGAESTRSIGTLLVVLTSAGEITDDSVRLSDDPTAVVRGPDNDPRPCNLAFEYPESVRTSECVQIDFGIVEVPNPLAPESSCLVSVSAITASDGNQLQHLGGVHISCAEST